MILFLTIVIIAALQKLNLPKVDRVNVILLWHHSITGRGRTFQAAVQKLRSQNSQAFPHNWESSECPHLMGFSKFTVNGFKWCPRDCKSLTLQQWEVHSSLRMSGLYYIPKNVQFLDESHRGKILSKIQITRISNVRLFIYPKKLQLKKVLTLYNLSTIIYTKITVDIIGKTFIRALIRISQKNLMYFLFFLLLFTFYSGPLSKIVFSWSKKK